ncbi:Hypothetical protein BN2458_PEG0156 [Helicobacter typhlonius]|uniref:Uncharacterized protein n=1 Tax=Helicobacter typhlonius TaxID=76936 RepID=A0A0S4PRT8_9HELI|nr:Hypothetical protein BN2458_PEG0156 [Helicobacter typhlonius]
MLKSSHLLIKTAKQNGILPTQKSLIIFMFLNRIFSALFV